MLKDDAERLLNKMVRKTEIQTLQIRCDAKKTEIISGDNAFDYLCF